VIYEKIRKCQEIARNAVKTVYADDEVEMIELVKPDQLKNIIFQMLECFDMPVRFGIIREPFSGLIGEDRVRKLLNELIQEGKVKVWRYGLYVTKTKYDELKHRQTGQRKYPYWLWVGMRRYRHRRW